MHTGIIPVVAAVAALPSLAVAQGPGFQSPGMPTYGQQGRPADSAQADRFTSGFNPAFSFIIDTIGDYVSPGDSAADDGFAAQLRSLELAGNAWVDPNAWAYIVAAIEPGEEGLNVEEAAVHYTGLGAQTTVRAGRFFIDFGKQMQTHVHELRTIERPIVLRALLGGEVKGEGVQYDQWTTFGESTVVRWSVGAFSNLLPEESEFPSLDAAGEPLLQEVAARKDVGDLNYTARLTGFSDVGESGVLQFGTSVRDIPSFSFVDGTDSLSAENLSNLVLGFDVTYGWTGETGQDRLTLGGEWLTSRGDTAAVVLDPDLTPGTGDEILDVGDDSLDGWYAFADYAWDRYNSAGLQYSQVDLPDGSGNSASEAEFYVTHMFSEYHRLRLGVISADLGEGDDDLRVALQYTATVGAHGHGISF
jgi:hypothetical protein